MQAMKYGAKSVTYSYRESPMGCKWPENVKERPAIAKICGNCACLIDGSSVEVSKIDSNVVALMYLMKFSLCHPGGCNHSCNRKSSLVSIS
jgi:cation diffusion facilitator CzcD-associated flavoprotein CzcO